MAKTAVLAVKIIGDSKGAIDSLDKTQGKLGKIGKAAGGLAVAGLAAAGTAAVGLGVAGAKSASDLEQSIGAVDTVFKGSADQMHAWAAGAAQDVGLTKDEFNQLGTLIGTQLKNGGTAMDELAPKTNELIGLGADLASMFGGTSADAVGALSSALKGERDPIERYGVSLTQAAIDAKAASLGFEKVGGTLSAEANQAATLALIMEQTADAHGNFAKESSTVAGQQQRLVASGKNLVANLGMALLPVLLTVFTFLNETAVPAVGRLVDAFTGAGSAGLADKLGLDRMLPVLQGLGTMLAGIVPQVVLFVTGTLVPGAQAIAAQVLPVLDTIGTVVLPALMAGLVSLVPHVLNVARNLVALGVAVAGRVMPVIQALLPVVVTVFGVVVNVVSGALSVVSGIVRTVTAVLTGDWSGAWTAIQDTVGAALDLVETIVSGGLEVLSSLWSAALDLIGDTVSSGLDGVVDFFTNLPDRILSGLGDLGGLLTGAAGDIIDGFVGGLSAGFDRVRNKLGELTNLLPDWKGPASKDKTLLTDAGQLIIGGLVDGLESKYGTVRRSLAGLTKDIARTEVAAPDVIAPDLVAGRRTGTARPSGRTVININVNGTVVDKLGTARAIRQLLQDEAALVGRLA